MKGEVPPTAPKENRMRIAQIASLSESVPPKLYGGTERVVSWFTDQLVDLGDEATFGQAEFLAPKPNWPRLGRELCGWADRVRTQIGVTHDGRRDRRRGSV